MGKLDRKYARTIVTEALAIHSNFKQSELLGKHTVLLSTLGLDDIAQRKISENIVLHLGSQHYLAFQAQKSAHVRLNQAISDGEISIDGLVTIVSELTDSGGPD